ncbi:hypothetical protein [Shouchella shacheensis]|uniref:hypothetical protein n=1 Tax=Shouchella shacheensis TaxID=1649580 RepID=UPI00073FB967|nr:hypothetical protein [Shouchella shacheensis]
MNKDILNVLFTGFLFVLFSLAALSALEFSRLAQFFPLYVSVAGAAFSGIYFVMQLICYLRIRDEEGKNFFFFGKPFRYIAWFLGYLVLIYLSGLLVATTVFLFTFLILESKVTFLKTSFSVAAVLGMLSIASSLLGIYWPQNVLGL